MYTHEEAAIGSAESCLDASRARCDTAQLKLPGFGSNLVLVNSLIHAARGAQAVTLASDGVAVTNYSNWNLIFNF